LFFLLKETDSINDPQTGNRFPATEGLSSLFYGQSQATLAIQSSGVTHAHAPYDPVWSICSRAIKISRSACSQSSSSKPASFPRWM
jgi:hypothetical protein